MRALFLGLGGVGQRHLRNLKNLRPEAQVAAVRTRGRVFEIGNDLKADPAVDIVAKYGVELLPDLAAALDWRPDLAVVSTPSSLHVPQCAALVAAGVPVFVEKPLAVSRDGLADFLAAADGAKVAVGYQLRHHPCVAKLRRLLAEDRVGRVQSVDVCVHAYMPSWHAYERPNEFYAGRRDLGGGVVLTEIHELDLMAWMFGRPLRVAAMGGRLSGLDIDVEDTVSVVLTLPGGVPATLALSFVQAPPMRRFSVNGERGRIVMDIPRLALTVETADGFSERIDIPDFDRNTMFLKELAEFLRWLDAGPAPSTTLASIRDGQDAALAILESLADGRMVELAP